jgi:hypothetical protein
LGNWITYSPPSNVLNSNFVIKVSGPDRLLTDSDNADLLPLLLAGNAGTSQSGAGSNDALSTLLMLKAFGAHNDQHDDSLTTLLLLNNSGDSSNNNLLTLLLLKNKDLF